MSTNEAASRTVRSVSTSPALTACHAARPAARAIAVTARGVGNVGTNRRRHRRFRSTRAPRKTVELRLAQQRRDVIEDPPLPHFDAHDDACVHFS